MKLNPADKKRLSSFYLSNLKKYGPNSPASVRWMNIRNQYVRFEVLAKIGDLNGKKLLDVGSGLGDFYDYLQNSFKRFKYLGIDVIPKMVAEAGKKYPQAAFEEKDIFTLNRKFDYVLSSGAMTFNVEGGKQFYFEMIKRMYDLSKIATGFNLLNDSHYRSDDDYLTYTPYEIADFVGSFARDYKIVTGYLPGDFSVFLYR